LSSCVTTVTVTFSVTVTCISQAMLPVVCGLLAVTWPQATSHKPQATSHKPRVYNDAAGRFCLRGERERERDWKGNEREVGCRGSWRVLGIVWMDGWMDGLDGVGGHSITVAGSPWLFDLGVSRNRACACAGCMAFSSSFLFLFYFSLSRRSLCLRRGHWLVVVRRAAQQ
jgi:hypothetical protein